jgi:hypothetical protein
MKTVKEYQEGRKAHYERIRSERVNGQPLDVMCPKCLVEMRNMNPGSVLASNPPQIHATCPNCKHVELLYA